MAVDALLAAFIIVTAGVLLLCDSGANTSKRNGENS